MAGQPCKRCLLAQSGLDDIRESILQQAAAIQDNKRASDEEYQRRLEFCMTCDSLLNGMCRECGCFVEYRAWLKDNTCPAFPARW